MSDDESQAELARILEADKDSAKIRIELDSERVNTDAAKFNYVQKVRVIQAAIRDHGMAINKELKIIGMLRAEIGKLMRASKAPTTKLDGIAARLKWRKDHLTKVFTARSARVAKNLATMELMKKLKSNKSNEDIQKQDGEVLGQIQDGVRAEGDDNKNIQP